MTPAAQRKQLGAQLRRFLCHIGFGPKREGSVIAIATRTPRSSRFMEVGAQRLLAHLGIGEPEPERRRLWRRRRELAPDCRGASERYGGKQREPVRQRLDNLDEVRKPDNLFGRGGGVSHRLALRRTHAEAIPVVEDLDSAR